MIPFLLAGCVTPVPELLPVEPVDEKPVEIIEEIPIEETLAEETTIEYTSTLYVSEAEILPSPHDEWLEAKELWEEMEMEKAEAFPGYEVQPYPFPDPDTIVEEVTVAEDPLLEKKAPVMEEVIQERQTSMTVAGTEVPDVFIYICTVLILAILLTLCYIAKQRKERYWYMRRSRE